MTAFTGDRGAAAARAAVDADRASVLDALTKAFAADPVVRWAFPDDAQYASVFPPFADAFGGGAIGLGTAVVAPGIAGAALWLPPDAEPDEEQMLALMAGAVSPERLEPISALFEQLDAYHPQGPHWYLTLIGVAPERQGEGHGSAMLEHALRLCDEARLPAFLEATCERNAALYRRHGFEALGAVQAGDSPTVTPMLRQAR